MHWRLKFLWILIIGLLPIGWSVLIEFESQLDTSRISPLYQSHKKLIEYGWDAPTAAFVRDHIDAMQARPFDGLAFKLTEGNPASAFDNRLWAETEIPFDTLTNIAWGNFSDNFIVLWASSPVTMDWFDDSRWDTITANMRLFSRAMKAARVKGVFFDPEFYDRKDTYSPWAYDNQLYPNHTLNEMESIVRTRGNQFIAALQTEKPDLRLLAFFFVSRVYWESLGFETGIPGTHYALYRAFVNGMLEASGDTVLFIDGHEHSYGYETIQQFIDGYYFIHEDAANYIMPELRTRYAGQVEAGNAIYLDNIMALRPEHEHGHSMDYKINWLKHNVYYSLATSDEYVWLYSEFADWWQDKVPPEIDAAVRDARRQYTNREPLGFEFP